MDSAIKGGVETLEEDHGCSSSRVVLFCDGAVIDVLNIIFCILDWIFMERK